MAFVEYIGVHLVDLPHGVRGFTKKNKDGSYTIMINARLSSEMQIHTYDHEIRHIENVTTIIRRTLIGSRSIGI